MGVPPEPSAVAVPLGRPQKALADAAMDTFTAGVPFRVNKAEAEQEPASVMVTEYVPTERPEAVAVVWAGVVFYTKS